MGFKTRSTIAILFLFGVLLGIVLVPTMLIRYVIREPGADLLPILLFLMILPFPVIFLLINYLISPLLIGWLFRVQIIDPETLATQYSRIAILLDNFRGNTKGMKKTPKFGIITDGNPNAFTYGWSRNTSRVVVTSGLLEICTQEEVLAVVNHELGHVKNNDVVLTVIISIVPMICYTIARAFMRAASHTGSSKSSGAASLALVFVAVLAYILYFVTYFVTLFISRMREFMADKYSAEETHNPNLLAAALVKIAYGLVRPPVGTGNEVVYNKKAYQNISSQQNTRISSLRTLGIFDKSAAMALALTGMGASGNFSPETISRAATWDLRNPWAIYYEIGSSHPLPAKRLIALNRSSIKQGLQPAFPLAEVDEYADKRSGKSLGREFVADIFISAGPTLVFFASIGIIFGISIASIFGGSGSFLGLSPWKILMFGIALSGFAKLGKTMFMFGGGKEFAPSTVLDLLGEIHVSPVRPIRVSLEGKVIGRGIPGYVLSEDFVLQDRTGFMRLDYNFGIGLGDLLFAIFRTGKLIGQQLKVYGWYRRGPGPRVQIKRIETADGHVHKCHAAGFAYFAAIFLIVFGLVLGTLYSF